MGHHWWGNQLVARKTPSWDGSFPMAVVWGGATSTLCVRPVPQPALVQL